MKSKRGIIVIVLLIVFIALLALFVYLIYNFYSIKDTDFKEINLSKEQCVGLDDNYALPDFDMAKNALESQDLVNDLPSNGKIGLKFYHYAGECKKFDKIYVLSKGSAEEKQVLCDMEIIIGSDYAKKIINNSFCDVIGEAIDKGEFEQKMNIGQTSLLMKYRSLMKYKSCFRM